MSEDHEDQHCLAAFFPKARKGRRAQPTQSHIDKKRSPRRRKTREKLVMTEVEL